MFAFWCAFYLTSKIKSHTKNLSIGFEDQLPYKGCKCWHASHIYSVSVSVDLKTFLTCFLFLNSFRICYIDEKFSSFWVEKATLIKTSRVLLTKEKGLPAVISCLFRWRYLSLASTINTLQSLYDDHMYDDDHMSDARTIWA